MGIDEAGNRGGVSNVAEVEVPDDDSNVAEVEVPDDDSAASALASSLFATLVAAAVSKFVL